MENVGSVVTGDCGRKREMRRGVRGESESGASADAAPGSVAPAPHQHHKGRYVTQQYYVLYLYK